MYFISPNSTPLWAFFGFLTNGQDSYLMALGNKGSHKMRLLSLFGNYALRLFFALIVVAITFMGVRVSEVLTYHESDLFAERVCRQSQDTCRYFNGWNQSDYPQWWEDEGVLLNPELWRGWQHGRFRFSFFKGGEIFGLCLRMFFSWNTSHYYIRNNWSIHMTIDLGLFLFIVLICAICFVLHSIASAIFDWEEPPLWWEEPPWKAAFFFPTIAIVGIIFLLCLRLFFGIVLLLTHLRA